MGVNKPDFPGFSYPKYGFPKGKDAPKDAPTDTKNTAPKADPKPAPKELTAEEKKQYEDFEKITYKKSLIERCERDQVEEDWLQLYKWDPDLYNQKIAEGKVHIKYKTKEEFINAKVKKFKEDLYLKQREREEKSMEGIIHPYKNQGIYPKKWDGSHYN